VVARLQHDAIVRPSTSNSSWAGYPPASEIVPGRKAYGISERMGEAGGVRKGVAKA
jgi:hypothetical protein